MKNIIKSSLIFLLLIFIFSCEEEIVEKVTLDISEVTGGAIKPLANSSYVLTYAEANNNFETIEWDSTDYGYPTSIRYILQIAEEGDIFNNAVNIVTTAELFAEINIEKLNDILIEKLEQTPEEPAKVQFRVVSTIRGTDIDSVFSAPISINITPYNPEIPPIYLIGDIQGWNAENAVDIASVSSLVYSGIAELKPDSLFRFFETKDLESDVQWGYSFFTDVPDVLVSGGDADDNFVFVDTVGGTYTITVDLNTKSIELE